MKGIFSAKRFAMPNHQYLKLKAVIGKFRQEFKLDVFIRTV